MSQRTTRPSSPIRPLPQRLRGRAKPAQLALTAMGGVLLVYAQAVAALGVGEPRYLSHLFEPLQVDIPVDTRGVDPAAVQVGVSLLGVDADTAAAVGSQLKREWRVDEHGGHVLRVTAPQAIHEPMLQLRVEVGDARIQAVRDLTLLFDPAPMPVLPDAATAVATVVPPLAAEPAEPAVVVAAVEPIAAVTVPAVDAVTADLASASVETPVVAAAAPAVEAADVIAAIEAELAADSVTLAERSAPTVVATAEPLALTPVPAAKVARITSARPVVTAAVAAPDAGSVASAPRKSMSRLLTMTPVSMPVVAALLPAATVTQGLPLTDAERDAQIASTLEPRALSAIDRWQRVRVVEGDTLEQLAIRVRGDHAEIPLPMVTLLLRWLNPRSFENAIGAPRPGAELRFPKPESLAAQIAVSGGVWTVDDLTTASGDATAAVPPPSFQLLTALSAESLDRALNAGASQPTDAAAAIATLGAGLATAGKPTSPVVRLSGGLVGGAALAGVLSMLLMLNMVVRTPRPQPARELAGSVVRSVTAPNPSAAARVLPARTLDLAALDLGRAADATRVQRVGDATAERADS
jgi:hypothetical protein